MALRVTIRKAKKEDRWKIRCLVWRACLNPTDLDWGRFVVGVDTSEKVVACGQIKIHRDGSKELASLVVAPKYRNRGLAHRIIKNLISDSDDNIYLICKVSLAGFYRKFGFMVVKKKDLPSYFKRIFGLIPFLTDNQSKKKGLLVMARNSTHCSGEFDP